MCSPKLIPIHNHYSFSQKTAVGREGMCELSKCYTCVALQSFMRAITDGLCSFVNHGQVTNKTPELVSPSPNFDSTPTEGRFSISRFNTHRPLYKSGLQPGTS
ncbi:hypothetical protein TNCV_2669091 [Trichonephila clavipes]|nr:hypothetical protein TNCV_2669091 [Trichonephila clavipes]